MTTPGFECCPRCGYVSITRGQLLEHQMVCRGVSTTDRFVFPITVPESVQLTYGMRPSLGDAMMYRTNSLFEFLEFPDDYESNTRLQERMGGNVKKAVKDIDKAAPLTTSSDMDTCPICLSDKKPETEVRASASCGHAFCAECIEKWLSEHVTCPMCMRDMSEKGGHTFIMNDRGADEGTELDGLSEDIRDLATHTDAISRLLMDIENRVLRPGFM